MLLIFDLDGTLIDSKLDLAHAVNAMLKYANRDPLEHATIFSYVGNGAPVLVSRALGDRATDQERAEALQYFLAYYRDHCLDHTSLYPHVRATLESLAADGHTQAVLTNKPVKVSKHILAGLGLGSLFANTYGGNSFEQKKPHPIGVQTLIAETGVAPEETLVIGDSQVDIRTAKNAGVLSCGVTYGFQPESLNDPAPDYLIDSMGELPEIVRAVGVNSPARYHS